MTQTTLPMIVLAGSDRRPTSLPERGRGKHPLGGNKAVDVEIGGRPLVATAIERLRACGRFGPIYTVGPAASLTSISAVSEVIDSDGTFGENIRAGLGHVRKRHPDRPIAVITCDVLPDVESLDEVMRRYDADAPCALWFPLVRAPRERARLGESSWKPTYRVVQKGRRSATEILPGHLAIADPDALRLEFVYRLIQLGYSTRNRPIAYRRWVMTRGVLRDLLVQDFKHILGLRWPTLTCSVLWAGLAATRSLRSGTVTVERLERALATLFVKRRWQGGAPHAARLPILDTLWLALDIDTEEEAREQGGGLAYG